MTARPTSRGANLQQVLEDFRLRAEVPGVTAAILRDDIEPWTGAAGVADPDGQPMMPETQFGIGSMTKSFVAALVLRLIDRGYVALQDPIARYLSTDADSNGATIEEVLAHRSGIPEHVTPRFVAELLRKPSRVWSPTEVLNYREGSLGRRGQFAYSSTNYILLGMIVERVTGAPVGTVMRDLLLEPLQLDWITYQGPETPPEPRAIGLTHLAGPIPVALRDASGLLPCQSVATAAGAAGGMAADVESLARWASLVYRGAVLEPDGQRALMGSEDHAFGSARFELGGEEAFGHPGRIPGYRGAFAYLPSLEMSCAVLLNTDAQEAEPMALLGRLLRASCSFENHAHGGEP
jgi:D-alanyl-D-alanine carboxypeptidase